MSFTENWGASGTEGVLNWQLSDGTFSIGTDDGTAGLKGWDGTLGTVLLNGSFTFDSTGSWYARHYCPNANESILCHLADTTDGHHLCWGLARGQSQEMYLYDTNWALLTSSISQYADPAQWIETHVTYNGGTWYGTVYCASGTRTKTCSSSGGYTFAKGTGDMVNPSIRGRAGSNTNLDIYSAPLTGKKTILDFVGTYDDGSSVGTYNLGDDVIEMGGVSEVGYIPYNQGGFCSQVTVSIDDINDAWQNFVGDMSNPSFFEGTFIVRHYWGTTWTTLRTCYLDPEDVTYNYGGKAANLTLHDVLGRRADEGIPLAGTSYESSLCVQEELGTIVSTDAENKTFVVKNNVQDYPTEAGPWFSKDDLLWNSAGSVGSRTTCGSAMNYDQYGAGTWTQVSGGWAEGTLGLNGTLPNWIGAGSVLHITQRFPTRSTIVNGFPSYDTHDYFQDVMRAWNYGDIPVAERTYLDYYPLDWAKVYHPGDKYKDILNDLCVCCMSSYAIDGEGNMSFFTDGCWSGTNLGTLNFNDTFNDKWTANYISATKQVRVEAGWDDEEDKYTVEYLSEEGTYLIGKTLKLECPWLREGVNAEYLADRVAISRDTMRLALSLVVEGSCWPDYLPRYKYTIENLPAALPVPSTIFRLMGKTYFLEDNTMTLTFESIEPSLNYFTWNESKWDGSDPWW